MPTPPFIVLTGRGHLVVRLFCLSCHRRGGGGRAALVVVVAGPGACFGAGRWLSVTVTVIDGYTSPDKAMSPLPIGPLHKFFSFSKNRSTIFPKTKTASKNKNTSKNKNNLDKSKKMTYNLTHGYFKDDHTGVDKAQR